MASLFADSTPGGGGGGVGGSAAGRKSFLYRCVNLLVTAMERCTKVSEACTNGRYTVPYGLINLPIGRA